MPYSTKHSLFITILLGSLILTGCTGEEKKEGAAAKGGMQMPPPKVHTLSVEPKEMRLSYEYPGRVTSINQVAVMARVNGTLLSKNFTEGQFVKKGTVLYKIDSRKYQAIVDKARAQVSVAEATLQNAERNHKRVQALYKDKAVSAQERDTALSSYEVAKAQLLSARAAVNDSLIDLDYTTVEAPISGITGKTIQDVGDLVGSSATNSHLVTITQLDPIYVEFSIPDTDIAKVKALGEKSQAQIRFDEKNLYPAKGHIDFFDTVIDQSSGTIALRTRFDNTKSQLLPGQFVRIVLSGDAPGKLIAVPQQAVMQSPQTSFVYVVQEGKATVRPVQLGQTVGTDWIIHGGLQPGDQVITDNLMKIRPGVPVSPLPAESKTQQPAA